MTTSRVPLVWGLSAMLAVVGCTTAPQTSHDPIAAQPASVIERRRSTPSSEPVRNLIAVGDLAVEDGGQLDMPAFDLACVAAADALTAPSVARARFEDLATKAGLPASEPMFAVLARDPTRSLADPPPRLCRSVPEIIPLKAPFFRAREPARRWLFRRIDTSVAVDTSALIERAAADSLRPAAPPRVLVGRHGTLEAVALPLASEMQAGPGQPLALTAMPAARSRSSR